MAKDGKILAVAFTDLNGDGEYSKNKDTLIASLNDTNHDKTADAGDTVNYGSYPLHVDGTGRGGFSVSSEEVTGVDITGFAVTVTTPTGSVDWAHGSGGETFMTFTGSNTVQTVVIADAFTE